MKQITYYLSIIISLTLFMAGCSDYMGETDKSLVEVKELIEPMDSKALVLQPAASATEYFVW